MIPGLFLQLDQKHLTLTLKSVRVPVSTKEDGLMLNLRAYGYAYYRYYDSGFFSCP